MTRKLARRVIYHPRLCYFSLYATSQKNCRRSFPDRNVSGRHRAGAARKVVRQQDQENLRADADPDAAETSQELNCAEEKRGRG